jgi:CRISPR-associated protein Cmr1
MTSFDVQLKMATPIWTGDARRRMDRLHTTGVMGSLRFWYEAIVRGLGGWVADPSADEPGRREEFDTGAYAELVATAFWLLRQFAAN